MKVKTIVVDGPVAFGMARMKAARSGAHGLQIVDMPRLAARLAGGVTRPATGADVEEAVAAALAAGGFSELEPVRAMPGMIRAASGSLASAWKLGLDLHAHRDRNPRIADLALLDRRVRSALPRTVLAPPDLAVAAIERVGAGSRIARIRRDRACGRRRSCLASPPRAARRRNQRVVAGAAARPGTGSKDVSIPTFRCPRRNPASSSAPIRDPKRSRRCGGRGA